MSITTGIAAGAAAVTKFMTSTGVTAVANGAAIATPILVGVNIYETKKVGDKVGSLQSEVGAVKRICLDVRETVYRTEGEILFNSAVNGMLPYEMDEEGQFTQTTDPQLLGAYNAAILGQNYQMAQPHVQQAPPVQAPVQYPAHMPTPAQQPVQQTVFVNTPESASTPTVEPAPAETVATTTPASVPVEDSAPPAWFQAYLKAQEAKEAKAADDVARLVSTVDNLLGVTAELKAEANKVDKKK